MRLAGEYLLYYRHGVAGPGRRRIAQAAGGQDHYNPASQIVQNTGSNDTYAWTAHGSGTTTSTANGLNQLTGHGGTGLTYDAKGNMTSDGVNGYGFSSENVFNSITLSGTTYTINRDPFGRYIGVTGQVAMIYDGDTQVGELNGPSLSLGKFIHGPSVDEPLVQIDGLGAPSWMHADERGSIIAGSKADGTIVGINRYDEHGKIGGTSYYRFQYTGQAVITGNLLNYKARTYHAGLGRFLEADPIGYGDGMNRYAYVKGDPVNKVDPWGTQETIVVTGHRLGGASSALSIALMKLMQSRPVVSDMQSSLDSEEIVVTGRRNKVHDNSSLLPPKTNWSQCLKAAALAGAEGFIDPLSIAAGIVGLGQETMDARNRTSTQDYGKPENRGVFKRPIGQAIRLGAKRFIPGYVQMSLLVGAVNVVFEVFKNPACGLSGK